MKIRITRVFTAKNYTIFNTRKKKELMKIDDGKYILQLYIEMLRAEGLTRINAMINSNFQVLKMMLYKRKGLC